MKTSKGGYFHRQNEGGVRLDYDEANVLKSLVVYIAEILQSTHETPRLGEIGKISPGNLRGKTHTHNQMGAVVNPEPTPASLSCRFLPLRTSVYPLLAILDQEKLVHLVCSVVLTSGPDEALMCRCARVMADWSSEPKFAKELGTKEEAGRSFSALMRSVSPKTKACFDLPLTSSVCRIRNRGRGGGRTHARRQAARMQP